MNYPELISVVKTDAQQANCLALRNSVEINILSFTCYTFSDLTVQRLLRLFFEV